MNTIARPAPGAVTARLAARGLAVLTLINLFNYLDRYVVSSLVESLRASELRLTDTQAGALMTGFIVVYMVASPFFGVLGDKGSRPRLLALGVFVWSLATAAAGLAKSFASLFAARAAVGIGEAAGTPDRCHIFRCRAGHQYHGIVHPPLPMMQFGVYGTQGSLQAEFTDNEPGQIRVVLDKTEGHRPTVIPFEPERDRSAYGHGATVIRYMRHFQECLDSDRQPSPGVEDGAKSVHVGLGS